MVFRDIWAILLVGVLLSANESVYAQMLVVEKGEARVPIILAADASADTCQAANDLITYIEKVSDAKPLLLKGAPAPLPKHAVWVGYSPELDALFPEAEFVFQHPEEVLLVCNESHLAIVGRDRIFENQQIEFGTANAVYTFLQDKLNVRWFWPGALGEDVIQQDTLAFEPFELRYHPQFRMRQLRGINTAHSRLTLAPETKNWARYQRLLLSSLRRHAGTSFDTWGYRFQKTHPEYLALQPDSTREPPSLRRAKICMSNPQVQQQWLDDVEAALKKDPSHKVFAASPADSYTAGICVCEECRALDVQDGPIWERYRWRGFSKRYVAMSDRYAVFANRLAQGLKERFPDRELYVYDLAYGPNTPAPLRTVMADNTIIAYVGAFPLRDEVARQEQRAKFAAWSKKAPHLMYRPNCGYFGGGLWGLPEVAMNQTIVDFNFLADHKCIGLDLDSTFGNWGTQGIQYYLYAQLAWNPRQDGKTLLADYYNRAFGPAAGEIEQYWQIMDQAREALYAHSKHGGQSRDFRGRVIASLLQQIFNVELLEQAEKKLHRAEVAVKNSAEKYQKRVAFVRAGFTFIEKMFESAALMERVRKSNGADTQAIGNVEALWKEIELLPKQFPFVIDYAKIMAKMNKGFMGAQEFFGPLSKESLEKFQAEIEP